jgi:hypothetical protein
VIVCCLHVAWCADGVSLVPATQHTSCEEANTQSEYVVGKKLMAVSTWAAPQQPRQHQACTDKGCHHSSASCYSCSSASASRQYHSRRLRQNEQHPHKHSKKHEEGQCLWHSGSGGSRCKKMSVLPACLLGGQNNVMQVLAVHSACNTCNCRRPVMR